MISLREFKKYKGNIYPQLKHYVCLKAHTTAKYDSGLNFLIHTSDKPFIYRYINENVYNILRKFDGTNSLQEILKDNVSFDDFIYALNKQKESEHFISFFSEPQSRPKDWALRIKPINKNTIIPINTLHFHITNKCNFECKHCYHINYRNNHDMNVKCIEKIFAIFANNNISFVYFTGGEPLLNPNLLHYFKILRSYKIPYGFISNLSLMNNSFIESLCSIGGCRMITTSLDGPTAEIHDEFRSYPGSFSLVKKNVAKLQKKGFNVTINSTINRLWIGKEHLWSDVLEKLNVSSWKTENPAITGNYSKNYKQYGLSPDELLKSYKRINEMIKTSKLKKQLHSFSIGRHIYDKNLYDFSLDDPICKHHLDLFFLEANGDIPYCSMFSQQLPMYGNIKNDDPIEIWNKICQFRLDHRLKSLKCNECNYVKKCGGGCIGLWDSPIDLIGCDKENKFFFKNKALD